MPEHIAINLNAVAFGPGETVIAEGDGLVASVFRYGSGVAALRIRNKVGEIIVLPFQGQQIADATFHGRRLTNRTMFDEPVPSSTYLGNCGGFLVHCGATAMGNPAPEDNHPLHGELPNLPYVSASLLAGHDAQGAWMGLTGLARHTVAFTHNYEIRPVVKLHTGAGVIDAEVAIRNLKHTPMELMYLAHVNFRPHDGGRLFDTVPDDAESIRIRTRLPGLFKPSESHKALLEKLKTDPALHRVLPAAGGIDPELVMGLSFRADTDGWAHAMQQLPDGSGDFISHRPDELPGGVRWIARNANQDALGLFLPGTAEADGYTAEKAKGNVLELAPRATFRCSLRFGALTASEAREMTAMIDGLRTS
jgi:Domain of unknown function (DUF4432)